LGGFPCRLVANLCSNLNASIGNAGHHLNLDTATVASATLGTLVYPGLPRGDGDKGMRGMDHQAGDFRCTLLETGRGGEQILFENYRKRRGIAAVTAGFQATASVGR
jgi:hypothetical protein